ncbi:MAG: cation:proton antiporter [Paracoccaceae bacterium]
MEGIEGLDRALLALGALLLLGLGADALGARTRVPRVTLLVLLGVTLGPPGFDLLPSEIARWYEFLAVAALSMVAFVLGGGMTAETLRAHGREILWVSAAVAAASAVFVAGGLVMIGLSTTTALVLGGIATATDPAATRDVVARAGGKGPFRERLLGVVAVDDAWGLIAFGVMLATAETLAGGGAEGIAGRVARELFGAVAIGLGVGLPAAFLTGRLKPGEPTRFEALGVVFLCAGLAVRFDVSFLLAGMTAGAVVANLASHHDRPVHEIEGVQGPFLVLFFVLAGASLEVPALGEVWTICLALIGLRLAGRAFGGLAGGLAAGLPAREGLRTGAALTPQAGVALGMALVAADAFPDARDVVIPVTVATTVAFELGGPALTALVLPRAGGEGGGRGAAGRRGGSRRRDP